MTQEDKQTLDKIRAVFEQWEGNRHKWRSSHAMVEISGIFDNAEIEKAHTRVVREDRERDRILAERMLS